MTEDKKSDGYIIEFQAHGAAVKVTIIDPATLEEVSLVGPSSASRGELERAAMAKLLYVQRRGREREREPAQSAQAAEGQKKPGIIV